MREPSDKKLKTSIDELYENLIKLKSEKDAIRIPLYHIDGVQLNDFSEIELLGV